MSAALEPCYAELGRFLKRQRERCGLTQDRAAELLGMERGKVAAIEAGRQRVFLHDAAKIRDVFSAAGVKALLADAQRRRDDEILAEAERIRAAREADHG